MADIGVNDPRLTKIEYYLNIAKDVSKRSTCLRIHYGAVLVKNDRIIATGYNGAARGFKNCNEIGICLRERLNVPHGERYELCRSVHAEANAISQAHPDEAENSTLYLYGELLDGTRLNFAAPCEMCKRVIANAKIEKIISYKGDSINVMYPSSWIDEEYAMVLKRIKESE